MTYDEIISKLSAAGIDDAPYEASLLLECFCGVSAAEIPIVKGEGRDFSSEELASAVEKRAGRYPLQYIIGRWSFCRESYVVSPDCLIPRADTELLVSVAAGLIAPGGSFIDAGTGSGCISVSLLAAREDINGVAFDISERVMRVAAANAALNGVSGRLSFVCGNMNDRLFWRTIGCYDAVISNPPYIATDELDRLAPELGFEPTVALDGGEDGLCYYRGIIKNGRVALKPGGVILLELGAGQADDVAEIAAEDGYFSETIYDIENRARVLVLRRGLL